MKLRPPTDKLAGCVWLPRFVDKARHHFAGTLDPDFVSPFCHPLATDGAFFQHFALSKDEILGAVASSKDDEEVARWFESRPQYTAERVAEWNQLAPNLGKEGFPMRRAFLFAMKRYYGGAVVDSRIDSIFSAIAFDEGFIGEA